MRSSESAVETCAIWTGAPAPIASARSRRMRSVSAVAGYAGHAEALGDLARVDRAVGR